MSGTAAGGGGAACAPLQGAVAGGDDLCAHVVLANPVVRGRGAGVRVRQGAVRLRMLSAASVPRPHVWLFAPVAQVAALHARVREVDHLPAAEHVARHLRPAAPGAAAGGCCRRAWRSLAPYNGGHFQLGLAPAPTRPSPVGARLAATALRAGRDTRRRQGRRALCGEQLPRTRQSWDELSFFERLPLAPLAPQAPSCPLGEA